MEWGFRSTVAERTSENVFGVRALEVDFSDGTIFLSCFWEERMLYFLIQPTGSDGSEIFETMF